MYILKNNFLRITISDDYCLAGIEDLKNKQDYLAAYKNVPLFSLTLSEFIGKRIQKGEIKITSRTAESVELKHDPDRITIKFLHLDNLNINVTCSVRISNKERMSYWSASIENNTDYAVRSLEYPIIKAVVPLSKDGYSDRILLPKADGYLLPSPVVCEWEGDYDYRKYNQRFSYPGDGRQFPENLCAQLVAYYDDIGGLYIAAYDGNGNPKKLGPVYECSDSLKNLDLSPVHCFAETPGTNISLSYETAVGCFDGDWQSGAEIYRDWASQQSWCSRKINERTDIPAWIKEGAFFLNFRLRWQPGGVEYITSVPEYCSAWQSALGIPIVAMMTGWEKHGEWLGPDYFPLYGEEKTAQMCAKLKAQGTIPFHFGLSGLKLPIRKRIGKDAPQPELMIDYDNRRFFEENYLDCAAVDSSGEVIKDSLISAWDGLHSYACVCTRQAEKQLVEASVRLVKEYNSVVVQADQIFGGGISECYASGHGHPPGRGPWQSEKLAELYDQMRAECKAIDPNYALSQEFPSELFIPHLDVCHGRVSDQPRGLWGVPLFAFLYHEYLSCFGGDWSSLLKDNTCGVYVQACNFVYGSQPAGSPQTSYKNVVNHLPEECGIDIIHMARQTCYLFQKYQRFLVFGKMLKTEKLDVPDIDVIFVGMDFSGWEKKKISTPSILHCLWEDQNGSRAYALANISSSDCMVKLPITKSQHPKLVTIDGEEQAAVKDGQVQFTLQSCTAAILEL